MKEFVGELVALVGGRNGNGEVSTKEPSFIGMGGGEVPTINHKSKTGIQKVLPAPVKKDKDKVPVSQR